MLIRTQKSLLLINHYQIMASSVASSGTAALRPSGCLLPFPLWSQQPRSIASDGRPPKEPPVSVEALISDPEITTKKFYVVEPSKSEPSLPKCPEPPKPCEVEPSKPEKLFIVEASKSTPQVTPTSSVNHLPPKPRLERCPSNVQLASQMEPYSIKDRVLAVLGTIFDSRNIARARHALVVAWDASVRTAQNVAYWFGVFLDSREYFYMRYYTLLMLEYAVYYVRTGLEFLARKMRGTPSKNC